MKYLYGYSLYAVHHRRKVWGLSSSREQHHTVESIAAHVNAIKEHFPNQGAETIRKALLMEKNIHVPRSVSNVCKYRFLSALKALKGQLFPTTSR